MPEQTPTTPETLSRLKGLRVWADRIDDLPQAACTLLEAANRQEITPAAILFELCEDSWNVYLVGDD